MTPLAIGSGLILAGLGAVELARAVRERDQEALAAGAVLMLAAGVAFGALIGGFFA